MRAQTAPSFPADIVGAARRIEERRSLSLASAVHADGRQPCPATMTDVTTRGCRLETASDIGVDDHVTVFIGATLIGGRVVWRDGVAKGVDFTARLMPKTLRQIVGPTD